MKEKEKTTVQWLKEFAAPYKGFYAAAVLSAAAGVICGIAPYFVISDMVISLLNGNREFSAYLVKGGIIALMWIARSLFHITSTTLSHKATFAVIAGVRKRLADKLVKLPLGYVVDTPSGKLKNIMVEKIDSIEPTLAHVTPEMTANILGPAGIILYLFLTDWRMALAALVTLPLGLLCYMGMMAGYEKNYANYVEKNKSLNETAVEYIGGIEVIKAFNQSASSYEKFTNAAREAAFSAINWMKKCNLYFSIAMGVFPAVLVGVLPIGCIFYIRGTLSVNTFVMVVILSLGIMAPLITAMSYTDDLAKIGTIVKDIAGVLSLSEMERPAQEKKADRYDIELKEVSFTYGGEAGEQGSSNVLKNINLFLKEGTLTALVGPSGGGKSTIAKLIASLWDTTRGEILIGGVPVKQMPLSQVNDMIAYVSQDNYLFDDTIRNNIRMGNRKATDQEVEQAARLSGCHEFILGLEKGYETQAGGAGGHLSGGERQRIAIARAMLKDAPIVILDEATAYTDPENEALVQASVARLVKGKTLLVVAHRLSTITDADKIVVIKDGQIEGEGIHGELLKKCRLYSDMWEAHIDARDFRESSGQNVNYKEVPV